MFAPMPNAAQLHLAFNHLPVAGLLFALGTAIAGVALKKALVRRTGMALVLVSALTSIPAFLSGEPAEEFIEHKVSGFSEALAHDHEEAAEAAFVVILLAGAAAAAALTGVWLKNAKFENIATAATFIAGFIAATLMLRAAHMGGLIHHEELRTVVVPTAEI